MPFPNYNIATETANGKVNDQRLDNQIVAAGPYTEPFNGVLTDRNANTVTTLFTTPPSPGDITTIEDEGSVEEARQAWEKMKADMTRT